MTDYNAWTLSIARCFCTSPAPCDLCMEAARRVVIRRRELRTILTSFALEEADLLVDCEILEPYDIADDAERAPRG